MSTPDHDFADDDDGYYSRSNRQSQIPDYDVTQEPSSHNLQTLPAFAYRQSQEFSPKRPTVNTSNLDHNASNGINNRSFGVLQHDNSPDPHDFYRQYRDSFVRRPESIYGSLDITQSNFAEGMASVRPPQRNSPVTGRLNGYNPSPASVRWSNRFENRNSSSPLADKVPTAGTRPVPSNTYNPRGRQSSLQALVKKFESVPDQHPPVPSKPNSRSTSVNSSPSNTVAPRSFRSRASLEPAQSGNSPTIRTSTRESYGVSSRKRSDVPPASSSIKSPKSGRRTAAVASNTFASQSMTDLNPNQAQKTKRPLFGEILEAGANTPDPGFGIPTGRRRRGSEGSMHHPSPMFQDDTHLMMKVSPSSPTAWYMGVTPSLDGIDLDKPAPPRPAGMHRRSRSDFGTNGAFTLAPVPSGAGRAITILSPPQEVPSPSPSTAKRSSQSRIPVSTRRASVTSDSGNSSGYRTPSRTSNPLSSSLPLQPSDHPARSNTPRRSPRHRNSSPQRQPSPRLAAYISEQAPMKSPPLRSSRPRLPVSAATTAASRARAAANSGESSSSSREKATKKMPEIGNVNMAARRQMITRAFTKSWHEREEDKKRRISSFVHDQFDFDIPKMPDSITPDTSKLQAITQASTASESDSIEPSEAYISAEELPMKERELTIDTSRTERSFTHISQEDSPTLGTAGFATTDQGQQDDSTPEPSSAATTGTTGTFFENEPQESPPDRRIEARNAEENANLAEGHGEEPPNLSTPRGIVQSLSADADDGESIQIMLSESPVIERQRSFEPRTKSPQSGFPSMIDGLEDLGMTGAPVEHQDTPQKNDLLHASMSSTISAHDDQPWSPESVNSYMSGATTLDSESYNTIDRLLDAYNDQSLMSPERMSEAQRRLFSQSPRLARLGGWDSSKTTQLYLQSKYRRSPDPTDMPRPLNVRPSLEGSSSTQEENTEEDEESKVAVPESDKGDVFTNASTSDSLDVPKVPVDHRASLTQPDDWINTSPSMLDWMQLQATDTPTDEREDQLQASIRASKPGASLDKPLLPDIPQGGLGIIDINLDNKADKSTEARSHPPPNVSEIYTSPVRRVEMSAVPTSPSRKPVPTKMSTMPLPLPNDAFSRSNENLVDGSAGKTRPETASTVTNDGSDRPSISSETANKSGSISSDQLKRLTKRKNIIKELIDTESSFGQDMTVVVDIYKGTSNVVLTSAQDERALFGNANDIVAFSMSFLDALKNSAKTVYVLPKSKRWRSKRDSNATTESTATDDQSSIAGLDLNDEEKDRLTNIGAAFLDHLGDMEKVYTEYLKNHEAANQKLSHLQKQEKVQVWLKECRAYALDLTTAWDLDSLLVKPVQRLLKYPLLLKELVEVTPENHPDFIKLDTAAREITGVSKRINDAKRRADLVEQVTSSNKQKKKEHEGRLRLPQAFGRRSDKLKQQVGLVENFQDRDYNHVAEKFGSHFFQLQVVMRDVEMYVVDVQNWVSKFNDVVLAIDEYFDVKSNTYLEIESKWRRFRFGMRDLQMTALTDHVNAVRKYVIEPMTTLLKLYDGPQRLMEKRRKRIPEFVRYKTMKDRGEKIDKRTNEQGEQFLAVNDTLKDELPKLFALNGRLVEACLNNFVQLQLQWQSVWKRKMIQAIELQEVPRSFEIIANDFAADFRYAAAQVVVLGICNGSLLTDASNLFSSLPPVSQTTTLVDDSSRRPSVNTESSRARSFSNAGSSMAAAAAAASSVADSSRSRGYSGQGGVSPMLPSPDLGRPTEGLGLGSHLTANSALPPTGRRVRASSSASSKSPVTPDIPSGWRSQQASLVTPYHNVRPSTSTGRSYENHIPRPSADGQQRFSSEANNRLRPDLENGRFMAPREAPMPGAYSPAQRISGVFSSAMPMSDSPRGQSPVNDIRDNPDYNVLFLAASVYEFNIDRARREAGYPYLTYVAGEIFDVIGEKGELWLAKNQDDERNQVGWIWNKHFAKLAS